MDLCEELLDEIFSRLPSKSLLRFRSLSKSLRARIDSPGFIRVHTLRSPKKFIIKHRCIRCIRGVSSFRIHHDKTMYTMHSEDQLSSYAGITPVDYPFTTDLTIVGSCNGLVCFHDYDEDIIHLWNPSIRRKLPLHKLPTSSSHARGYISKFSPSKFRHGFGFDPIIDDYKIVRFSKEGGTFVYTMKMNTWREVASPVPPYEDTFSSQCLFNGALYWAAGGYSGRDNYVLRFDLSSEIFSKFELPRRLLNPLLTIIKGCLAVLLGDDYSRIWVRNTVAASWSSVAFEDKRGYLHSAHGGILYSHCSEGIIVYNPETEARSRLAKLGDHDHDDYIIGMIGDHDHDDYINGMITCVESLELLDIGTSCDVITRKNSS